MILLLVEPSPSRKGERWVPYTEVQPLLCREWNGRLWNDHGSMGVTRPMQARAYLEAWPNGHHNPGRYEIPDLEVRVVKDFYLCESHALREALKMTFRKAHGGLGPATSADLWATYVAWVEALPRDRYGKVWPTPRAGWEGWRLARRIL